MHRWEETAYGFRVTLEGFMDRDAMAALRSDVEAWARGETGQAGETAQTAEFSALIDLRRAAAFPAEAQEVLAQCVRTLREHGMGRHAVVLSSALATLQAKRLWRDAAATAWCRFLDVSVEPEWERLAVDWIAQAIEPPG